MFATIIVGVNKKCVEFGNEDFVPASYFQEIPCEILSTLDK